MTSYRNKDQRPPIMAGAPPAPEWRVPRENWDRAPWNRWSFQNISKILPTAPIRRSGEPLAWDTDLQDLTGLTFPGSDGQATTFGNLLDGYVDGFLVARHGKIVHESYHNGMSAKTPHLAQSVSKSVVSTTAGCLIGDGLLDPHAPITAYLPELGATAWAGATLQHVLDMTTGVAFVEHYEAPDSDIARLDVASGWKPVPADADDADWPGTIWDQVLSLKANEADHGARFKYRSIETDVLGLAIARATGQHLAQVISDRIWAPMGAAEDANLTLDGAGTPLADGGMSATLRDFARFGQTMLDHGRAGGRQVIPPAWVDDVRRGDHGRFDNQSREFMPNGRYRNMFWIRDGNGPVHISLGIFGQFFYVDPDCGLLVVQLASWPESLSEHRHADTMLAIDAIAARIC